MELNLTIEHLADFCLMAYLASLCVTGHKLVRMICWIALWQLVTPVRPIWQDVPMMVVGLAITEWVYRTKRS